MRIVTTTALLLATIATAAFPQAAAPTEEAREIVRKSLQADNRNEILRRDYTYKVLSVHREPAPAHSDLFEVLSLNGDTYRHLLEKNGKALAPDEARKEQERLDFAIEQKKKLSEAERRREAHKRETARAKQRELFQHIPQAFDFTPKGEAEVNGRAAWVIAAAPRKDYHGDSAAILRHMNGTLWIDKQDYQWVRVEAQAMETISLGWFIARIAQGTHISIENSRINGEIWAPKRVALRGSARVALVKKISADQESIYSDYRKFQTDARMIPTEEPPKP